MCSDYRMYTWSISKFMICKCLREVVRTNNWRFKDWGSSKVSVNTSCSKSRSICRLWSSSWLRLWVKLRTLWLSSTLRNKSKLLTSYAKMSGKSLKRICCLCRILKHRGQALMLTLSKSLLCSRGLLLNSIRKSIRNPSFKWWTNHCWLLTVMTSLREGLRKQKRSIWVALSAPG